MTRLFFCVFLTIGLLAAAASPQDVEQKAAADSKKPDTAEKLVSGPQKGATLPGPCDVYVFNGSKGKGRYHCPVCEFGNDPVLLAFVHESATGKDGPLNQLIAHGSRRGQTPGIQVPRRRCLSEPLCP